MLQALSVGGFHSLFFTSIPINTVAQLINGSRAGARVGLRLSPRRGEERRGAGAGWALYMRQRGKACGPAPEPVTDPGRNCP